MADLGAIAYTKQTAPSHIANRISGTVTDDVSAPASRRLMVLSRASVTANRQPAIICHRFSKSTDGTYVAGVGLNTTDIDVICYDDDAGTVYNALIKSNVSV